MSDSNLILLGHAARAHGLKGHAIFHLAAGHDSHLEVGHKIWLMPSKGSLLVADGAEFVIEEIHYGNDIRVRLEGVPDRTALEKLLPFEIYCDRSQFPELPEGEFYVDDLLGLTVVTPEGKAVGKLADFYETAAQLVFTIRFNNGSELDLPYVSNFFPSVDLEAGTITAVLPEVIE
jgi:16S rRNA processing protein RimM